MQPRFCAINHDFGLLISSFQEGERFDLWFCEPTIDEVGGAVIGLWVNPTKIALRKADTFADLVDSTNRDVASYRAFAFKTEAECMAFARDALVQHLPKYENELKSKLARVSRAEVESEVDGSTFDVIKHKATLVKAKSQYIIAEHNLNVLREMIGKCGG